MAVLVRQADLSSDREELIRFCHQNLPVHPDARRFDWLYLENPFGRARVLIASDDTTGEMIGIASAFPRQFWIKGGQRAWILGDFCIVERFRTLGPAVILQRACMAGLPPNELWYDFPSRNMLAVYQRLRVPIFSEQIRHVRLLSIDRRLGKAGSYIAKTFGWFRSRQNRPSFRSFSHIDFEVHEGRFEREFTELDSDPGTHQFIRGSRTAEYLNWRYRENPGATYKVITARKGSRLVGYLVVDTTTPEATLTDLLVIDAESTLPKLLDYMIRVLLKTDTGRLNASLLSESDLSPYFRLAGFVARETVPVVVHGREGMNPPDLNQPKNWLLLHGDRES